MVVGGDDLLLPWRRNGGEVFHVLLAGRAGGEGEIEPRAKEEVWDEQVSPSQPAFSS